MRFFNSHKKLTYPNHYIMQTCICMLIALLVFTWKSMHHSVFGNFSTYNVIETELNHFQPIFHLWANQVAGFFQQNVWENTCKRVTFYVKMQVKSRSCTGVFSHILLIKTKTWFSHMWNIGWKWVKQKAPCFLKSW